MALDKTQRESIESIIKDKFNIAPEAQAAIDLVMNGFTSNQILEFQKSPEGRIMNSIWTDKTYLALRCMEKSV